jgi:hypothetical protein
MLCKALWKVTTCRTDASTISNSLLSSRLECINSSCSLEWKVHAASSGLSIMAGRQRDFVASKQSRPFLLSEYHYQSTRWNLCTFLSPGLYHIFWFVTWKSGGRASLFFCSRYRYTRAAARATMENAANQPAKVKCLRRGSLPREVQGLARSEEKAPLRLSHILFHSNKYVISAQFNRFVRST